MSKQVFTRSDTYNAEYACTIVKIGELHPIEGKDMIVSTLVNGMSMVVRKDQVKEGDIRIYAMNETQLNEKFLSANNLFDIDNFEKNSNAEEVRELKNAGDKDGAKRKVGFFNKYGRVKLIRLGGIPSYGYIFSVDELAKVYPEVLDVNLEELVDTDFDTVCGEEFVKVYVPPVKEGTPRANRGDKRNRKLNNFNRMIPGQFAFHYDSQQLARYITRVKPTDVVTISVKLHGTSAIYGNVLTKAPKWDGLYSRVFPYLPKWLQFSREAYGLVYSSRKVIKNQYINQKVTSGYYGTDVWAEYAALLDGKIPQGMTIYGEIVGYLSGDNKMIQKGYDYGCPVGTNKLMIYRITTDNGDGTKREWNVAAVYDWTIELMNEYPIELKDKIHPIDILYHGTLHDLYPTIDIANHWHENVLQSLKDEKELFGMELDEPLCKNKVPREGIVLRIDDDEYPEAFKLKCSKFMLKESAEIDSNGVNDIEMQERYGEGDI